MSHPSSTVGAVASIMIVAGASIGTWALLMWMKNRPTHNCNCQFHCCRHCSLKEDR